MNVDVTVKRISKAVSRYGMYAMVVEADVTLSRGGSIIAELPDAEIEFPDGVGSFEAAELRIKQLFK
jgi:hypothetical protein